MRRTISFLHGLTTAAVDFFFWPAVLFTLLYALAFAATTTRADDSRERRTEAPQLGSTRAMVPIPPELHLRNTVGTDRAGLCVDTSLTVAGRDAGVPGIERLLPHARQNPGGSDPDKLAVELAEVLPGEKYASYVGAETAGLERMIRDGYRVSATMNTGALYGWERIHHFVNPIHLDSKADLACVVDSNQPGVYTWMTARDYKRRFIDGTVGWWVAWLRRPMLLLIEHRIAAAILLAMLSTSCLCSVLALAARRWSSRTLPLEDEAPDDGPDPGQV